MRAANKKTIALLTCFVVFMLLPGCTNWEKKYDALSVEHENTKGLLEKERSEKGQLADQVSQSQQTIEELQRYNHGNASEFDIVRFRTGYAKESNQYRTGPY